MAFDRVTITPPSGLLSPHIERIHSLRGTDVRSDFRHWLSRWRSDGCQYLWPAYRHRLWCGIWRICRCRTEQENINGLPSPSEISLSGNFYKNPAQDALREAYDNDTTYAFQVIFPSGKGFKFLAEIRQHTWSSGTNGVVAATFSLRLKGKPENIESGS